jgi:gliding motility-associated-like protein
MIKLIRFFCCIAFFIAGNVQSQTSQFSLFGQAQTDFGTWIAELPSGGFAHTNSFALNFPTNDRIGTALLNLDCAGKLQWQKIYGFDNASLISKKFLLKGDKVTLLGSFSTSLNAQQSHIIELDKDGIVLNQYALLSSQTELPKDLLPWPTGGYLGLSAGNYNVGLETCQLYLVNSSFNVLQSLSFSLAGREFEPESMIMLSDGTILICGDASSTTTFRQGWIMRLSAGGVPMWAKSIESEYDVELAQMVLGSDGLVHVVGSMYQLNSGYDGLLLKVDVDGNFVSEKVFHSTLDDKFRSIAINNNNEIMVGGDAGDFENRPMVWMRTNMQHQLLNSWKLNYGNPFTNYIYCVSPTKSGAFIMTGEFTAPNVRRDGGMIRTDLSNGGNCAALDISFTESSVNLIHTDLNVVRTELERTKLQPELKTFEAPIFSAETICTTVPPVAKASYSIEPECPSVCVQFNDSSYCSIEEWNWSFPLGNPANSTEQNPKVCFPGDGAYIATLIVSNEGGSDTLEINMNFDTGCKLPVPNVFSPNSDGFNDFFTIPGLPIGSSLHVFNRWGNEVFNSDNYLNNWDGKTSTGIDVSDGIYFYVINTPLGKSYEGYLSIMR